VKRALLAVWLCAIVVVQAAKISSRAELDPKFTFAGVRTWAWTPAGAGDVYTARSSEDEAAPVKKRIDPVVVDAVARELDKTRLTRASAGVPDVTLHYYVLVTVGMDAQVVGQFLPPITAWGVPPFAAATQSLSIVTRGSLVLDVTSTSLGRVVWRGVAQSDIDIAETDAERDRIIRDAAGELVKRLPLKK
jgi:hypothetical protein